MAVKFGVNHTPAIPLNLEISLMKILLSNLIGPWTTSIASYYPRRIHGLWKASPMAFWRCWDSFSCLKVQTASVIFDNSGTPGTLSLFWVKRGPIISKHFPRKWWVDIPPTVQNNLFISFALLLPLFYVKLKKVRSFM